MIEERIQWKQWEFEITEFELVGSKCNWIQLRSVNKLMIMPRDIYKYVTCKFQLSLVSFPEDVQCKNEQECRFKFGFCFTRLFTIAQCILSSLVSLNSVIKNIMTALLLLFLRLQSLISSAPVMVFMKGSPDVSFFLKTYCLHLTWCS